jgi:hypothetical protein
MAFTEFYGINMSDGMLGLHHMLSEDLKVVKDRQAKLHRNNSTILDESVEFVIVKRKLFYFGLIRHGLVRFTNSVFAPKGDLTIFGCVEKNPGPIPIKFLFRKTLTENKMGEMPDEALEDVFSLSSPDAYPEYSLYTGGYSNFLAAAAYHRETLYKIYSLDLQTFVQVGDKCGPFLIATIVVINSRMGMISINSRKHIKWPDVRTYIKSRAALPLLNNLKIDTDDDESKYGPQITVNTWHELWSVLDGPLSLRCFTSMPGWYDKCCSTVSRFHKDKSLDHNWLMYSMRCADAMDSNYPPLGFLTKLPLVSFMDDDVEAAFHKAFSQSWNTRNSLLKELIKHKDKKVFIPALEMDYEDLKLATIDIHVVHMVMRKMFTKQGRNAFVEDLTVFGCVEKNPGPNPFDNLDYLSDSPRQSETALGEPKTPSARRLVGSIISSATTGLARRASSSSSSFSRKFSVSKQGNSLPERKEEPEFTGFYLHLPKLKQHGLWAKVNDPIWEASAKKILLPHLKHVYPSLRTVILSANYVDNWTDFDRKPHVAEELAKVLVTLNVKVMFKAEDMNICVSHEGVVSLAIYNISHILKLIFDEVRIRPATASLMYLDFPLGVIELNSASLKAMRSIKLNDMQVEINHMVSPVKPAVIVDKSFLNMGIRGNDLIMDTT